MPDTKNTIIKRLDRLTGQSIIDPNILKHFFNPETRQELLEEFDFKENEIETIMSLEFKNIVDFARKAYEAFGISSDMSKERK